MGFRAKTEKNLAATQESFKFFKNTISFRTLALTNVS